VHTRLPRGIFWLLFAACVLLRIPSLQQPAGADQALYGYVGQRILHGELPYRDAWDQKPPGIHATYAVLWALWPDERVVPAADLAVAVVTACCSWRWAGGWARPAPARSPRSCSCSCGDPAWGRLVAAVARGQCEVFIGLVSTARLLLLHRTLDARTTRGAGVGFAAAGAVRLRLRLQSTTPARLLIAAMLAALWWWRRDDAGLVPGWRACAGCCGRLSQVASRLRHVVATMLAIFAIAGAFDDCITRPSATTSSTRARPTRAASRCSATCCVSRSSARGSTACGSSAGSGARDPRDRADTPQADRHADLLPVLWSRPRASPLP
jgi:hypothetical protein